MDVSINPTLNTLNAYNYMNQMFMNPTTLIIVGITIIAYFLLFMSLGKSSSSSTSSSIEGLESSGSESSGFAGGLKMIIILFVVVILFILIINSWKYFYGMSFTASVKNLFYGSPEVDIVVAHPPQQPLSQDIDLSQQQPVVPEIKAFEQVFNIPGNYYDYNNAKALCSAYGARLATYDEVENAYNNGGEWCNYGWSEGQMALFPTQKNTYDNLQKIKGHEHDCGRPGVNGGYIANKNVRFGVNCYGYKPKITQEEDELMEVSTPYPKTKEDILMEEKVDFWKTQLDNILVSPFNYNNWSRI